MEQSSKILDSSYIGLKNQDSKPQLKIQRKKLPKLKTQQNQSVNFSPQKTRSNESPTKFKKPRIIPPGYEMAKYQKAIQHWNQMSYSKKSLDLNGEPYYTQYSITDDLTDLKQYGLGIYLYLQFIKRLLLTCFVISALLVLQLYVNYQDDGLSTYKASFTLTLAKFTLGNLTFADQKTYIMESAVDVLSMVILFGFYIHWRAYHNQAKDSTSKDSNELDPTMYVVTVVGFDKKMPRLEQQLRDYFDTIYRGAFQVQVVYNFKRNFNKFIEYEQIIQKVEKQKQVIRQSDKTNEDLLQLQKELQEKQEQIGKINNDFQPIYAIIHFRNLKSKYAFINVCRKHGLVNKWTYSFSRCICMTPGLPDRLKFKGRDTLMIQHSTLPRPEGINWNNIDITGCSYLVRFIFSLLFIAISIFITSSLITLCTLYVSTSSNCGNYDQATTFTQAKDSGDKLTIYCYCSANYASIYTNSAISSLCSELQQTILIANIVQIAASLLSTVTNIILIVIVTIIAQKLLKPQTKPKQYNFIFVSVFLSNLINTTILPLFLNGDIFGFKSVSYLRFISFINFDNVSIFKDFDRNWFAVISPYYTNFFLIASISPIIQLLVYSLKRRFVFWRLKKKCQNNDLHDPTIQKEANQMVCAFPIDLPTQMAVMTLQFFMCFMYSSLIPLAIPIFTFGLFLSFICKNYIILNYTKRIPADESLNQKIINMIPFILLVHGLMGVWARTSQGIFDSSAFFYVVDVSILGSQVVRRAVTDIIMIGATALVLLWIIIDFTFISFFSFLRQSCKDELQLPVQYAAIQNALYADRLRKVNIVGSYKLVNNPTYKHPYKAYLQLTKRTAQQKAAQKPDLGSGIAQSSLNLNSQVRAN